MGRINIAAGDFKARCLSLLDEVKDQRTEIVVTKRGKPIAKLVPMSDEVTPALFGAYADSGRITGDILSPIEDHWDANQD